MSSSSRQGGGLARNGPTAYSCARSDDGNEAGLRGRSRTGACCSPDAPRAVGTHETQDSRTGGAPAPVPSAVARCEVVLPDRRIPEHDPTAADYTARPPFVHSVPCQEMRVRLPLCGGVTTFLPRGLSARHCRTWHRQGNRFRRAFSSSRPINRFADVHTAILRFPPINGRITDAEPSEQIGNGNLGHRPLQNAGNLVYGEPAALNLCSSQLGQCKLQPGLVAGSNVSSNQKNASICPRIIT